MSWPLPRTRLAIGSPIAPKPRNPTFIYPTRLCRTKPTEDRHPHPSWLLTLLHFLTTLQTNIIAEPHRCFRYFGVLTGNDNHAIAISHGSGSRLWADQFRGQPLGALSALLWLAISSRCTLAWLAHKDFPREACCSPRFSCSGFAFPRPSTPSARTSQILERSFERLKTTPQLRVKLENHDALVFAFYRNRAIDGHTAAPS